LFRFDSALKENKERGIGEIKVFQFLRKIFAVFIPLPRILSNKPSFIVGLPLKTSQKWDALPFPLKISPTMVILIFQLKTSQKMIFLVKNFPKWGTVGNTDKNCDGIIVRTNI
jgi:hypothetical protein